MARPRPRPRALVRHHRLHAAPHPSGVSGGGGSHHPRRQGPAATPDSRRSLTRAGAGPSSPAGCRRNTTVSGSYRTVVSSGSNAPHTSLGCRLYHHPSAPRQRAMLAPATATSMTPAAASAATAVPVPQRHTTSPPHPWNELD